ncbi:hypothetical protein L9F63_025615, partial [Diploptera punctata]
PEPKLPPKSSFQMCEDVDNWSRSGPRRKLGDTGKSSAIEDEHINRRSITSKISGDSAYSSLNRKSPLADVISQGMDRQIRSAVGCRCSLPELKWFRVFSSPSLLYT